MEEILGICELLLCCCFLFDNSEQRNTNKHKHKNNYIPFCEEKITAVMKRN